LSDSAASGDAGREFPVPHHRFITVSIMLATVMQVLDSTIANVALPHMAGNLSASRDQISWVLTSYIVASAIATPLTGWLSGRYGRKRIFLASIAGFTIASMLCGIAGSLPGIVGARLLQGAFGAGLVPLSQAVMLDINPRHRHGEAMALWGMGVMVGPIVGPALGGWLTEDFSWRWVFFINVPFGVLSYYGLWRYTRETPRDASSRFDVFGFVTLSLAIGLMQMMLDRGEQKDWFSSTEILVEGIGAAVALLYFLVHTFTTPRKPFFNLALLRDRNYASGLVFYFLVGLILYATRALLPTLLQELMGYPVITTGWVTGPSALGTVVAMMMTGRLVSRVDARILVSIGFAMMALSLWQMSGYTLAMGEGPIIWPGFIQGMGLGFVAVPLTTLTFSTLPASLRSDGTSIYSLSRNIGSSIGISVMQTLLTRNTATAHSDLAAHISPYNPMLAGAAVLAPHGGAALEALNRELTRQAAMVGYIDDFWIMMVACLAAMPLLLFLRGGSRAAAPASAAAAME
jgi:DHA2 family multidrug resistance protein